MHNIQNILDKKNFKFSDAFLLRSFQSGDMGWVAHRHGVLYAQEYGWDTHFEALVAQILADFINNYKPKREKCIIAEMNSEIVGSVFVVQSSDAVAKLRLLLVEPGFKMIDQEAHHSFGKDLIGETWELIL